MSDEVTESLLNQLRGDADNYQVMKLDQLVLSYKFIENVDQLEMTSEIQNTIYIPKEVGNSRAVNSKLAIVDDDIISSKLHNQKDDLKKMAIMVEVNRQSILEHGDEGDIDYVNLGHELQRIQQAIRDLESGWIFAALELNSDIILSEYLHYLFSRTAGDLMARSVISSGWIAAEKLPEMPVLVPSIEAQKNTLKIRKEIDHREAELVKLRELLLDIDKHDLIRIELEKMKTDAELVDLVLQPESEILEFKSSVWARYNNETGEIIREQKSRDLRLEDSVVKSVAAFLNTQGGKLIIGVQDQPQRKVVGIEPDFKYSGKSRDVESFQNSLRDLIKTATNDPVIVGTFVEIRIESIEDKSICVIEVKQKAPKSWTYVDLKNWKNKGEKKECFFLRSGPSSNIIGSRRSADEWKSARKEGRL